VRFLQRLARLAAFLNIVEIEYPDPVKAVPSPAKGAGKEGSGAMLPDILPPSKQSFIHASLLKHLPQLSPAERDTLNFGCVQLDDKGTVLHYNRWESEFAGVEPQNAVGINFFRELAPCTNNRLIYGRFKDGISANELNVVVSYAFTYKMRPTLVDVHLYRDPDSQTNWVLVQKAESLK
jgi:photoactive yellow protein